MATAPHGPTTTNGTYLVGLALALLLTAIPFGLVAAGSLAPAPTVAVIACAAIAQIIVHLRFFLHLQPRSASQDKLIALCFAFVILFIVVGGTLWIMFDLNYRMM
jgi:cytochrome o ubiquinol oxidase subunit IV